MNATQLNLFDLGKAIEPSKSQIQYSSKKLSIDLIDVLKNVQINQIEKGWEIIIPPKLERGLYEEFKKLLKALKGHWNKKTHLFYYDPTEKIQDIISVGKYPETNPHAFFPTPDDVVETMAIVGDFYHSGDNEIKILEPSAGDGSIIRGLLNQIHNLTPDCFDCCEIDPENVEILESQGLKVVANDFFKHDFSEKYHWVFMNPPFSVKNQLDCWLDHVKKAYSLLKKGGKLIAILPPSFITSNKQSIKEFREYVGYSAHWEHLPQGAFIESGTGVSTICICITKFDEKDFNDLVEDNVRQIDWCFSSDAKYVKYLDNWLSKVYSKQKTVSQMKTDLIKYLDGEIKHKNIHENCCFIWDKRSQEVYFKDYLTLEIEESVIEWLDKQPDFDCTENRHYYSLEYLQSLPTIKQGHFENLKIRDNGVEVWLSRMTVEDGESYNNKVTVKRDGKKIGSYQAL